MWTKYPATWKTLCAAIIIMFAAMVPTASAAYAIFEDDIRWDCATMGNRMCGPGYGPLAHLETLTVWTFSRNYGSSGGLWHWSMMNTYGNGAFVHGDVCDASGYVLGRFYAAAIDGIWARMT